MSVVKAKLGNQNKLGNHVYLPWNGYGGNIHKEDEIPAFKTRICETVSSKTAGAQLNNGRDDRQLGGIEKEGH